jgi:pimeloyl-ACP methyl ester carboxylesterase
LPSHAYEHCSRLVALEEVGLHYCEWGDSGPDVLIIHGIMGTGVRWDLFARSLMDDFHVIAPDLRGHGQSARAASYRIEDYARDMEQLIECLELRHPIIVGHSLGGAIAMKLVGSGKIPCSRLVIVDMGAELTMERAEGRRNSWRDAQREWDGYDELLEHIATNALPRPDIEDPAEFIFNHFDWTSGGKLRERLDPGIFDFERWDLWEDVRRIQAPTLLLRGEHSEALLAERAARMVDEMADIRLVEMPDTIHSLQVEDPANFNRIAGAFLRGQPDLAPS